jgi:hypothetical protein
MPDISQNIDPIVSEIYQQYEKQYGTEKARTYLGASIIGRECKRALWYGFRWAAKEQFDGRLLRLFQTGHLAEPRFVADLRSIGATVHEVDPNTGNQFAYSDLGGHMRGNTDGVAQHIPMGGKRWHVCEFKTHGSKSFAKLKKEGVKKAKPEHWIQMNTYMGWSGIDRALYLAVDKDTDELHSERLEFEPLEFERTRVKAESIIFGGEPPAKISDDPKFYLCSWCTFNKICHSHQVPAVTCRSCVHSTPEREGDGRWSCAHWKQPSIPVDFQRVGCDQHLPLPFLLTYAEAVDAGEGWIGFVRKDNGAQFLVAVPSVTTLHTNNPTYTTHEISAAADHRVICNAGIDEIRTAFGASIKG